MLTALQLQLDVLSLNDEGKFEQKIRGRWQSDLPQGYVREMKEFIGLLPKIERAIFNLYVWLPDDSDVKKAGNHFLTYMYEPDDFIPEGDVNGLFGYIDDAYIAALFYELMIEEIVQTQGYRLREVDKVLLQKVMKLRKKAKKTIPKEADQIQEMLNEIFRGEKWIYDKLFGNKKLLA